MRRDLNGILVVDKPEGPTSFGVVRTIKKVCGIKKIGHTGTLDPMATGVLILCLGKATKLVPFLQSGQKEYQGRMILGLTTDTDDITGRVLKKKSGFSCHVQDVLSTAREFVGSIEQVPPAFSAVKIQGRPAYELARQGQKVPARSRWVDIYRFEVTEVNLPRVSFVVSVSKGTYIRSLAADMGRRLGLGGCLETLRRTRSAPFSVNEAVSTDEVVELARQGRLEEKLIPMDRALSFMPGVLVSDRLAEMVRCGRPLPISYLNDFSPEPGPVRVQAAGHGLLAVYEYKPRIEALEGGFLTPLRVLGGNN
jgi:tRNA pseudouridine55 synthase